MGDAFEFTHDEQNSTKFDVNLLSHDDNDLPLKLPEVATLIRSDGTKFFSLTSFLLVLLDSCSKVVK